MEPSDRVARLQSAVNLGPNDTPRWIAVDDVCAMLASLAAMTAERDNLSHNVGEMATALNDLAATNARLQGEAHRAHDRVAIVEAQRDEARSQRDACGKALAEMTTERDEARTWAANVDAEDDKVRATLGVPPGITVSDWLASHPVVPATDLAAARVALANLANATNERSPSSLTCEQRDYLRDAQRLLTASGSEGE